MMDWVDVSLHSICLRSDDPKTNLVADGFFDAGMLLQALKKDQPKPADQIAQRRRTVGKKLALTEY